eukprot:403343900
MKILQALSYIFILQQAIFFQVSSRLVSCYAERQLPLIVGEYGTDNIEILTFSYQQYFDLIVYGGILNGKPFVGIYQNNEQYFGTVQLSTLKSNSKQFQIGKVVSVQFSYKDGISSKKLNFAALLEAAVKIIAQKQNPYSIQQFFFDKDDGILIMFNSNDYGYVARLNSDFKSFQYVKKVSIYKSVVTAIQHYEGSYLFFASIEKQVYNATLTLEWISIGCLSLSLFTDVDEIGRKFIKSDQNSTTDLGLQLIDFHPETQLLYGCLGNLGLRSLQNNNYLGYLLYSIPDLMLKSFYFTVSADPGSKLTCIGMSYINSDQLNVYYQNLNSSGGQEIYQFQNSIIDDLSVAGNQDIKTMPTARKMFIDGTIQLKYNFFYSRNTVRNIYFSGGSIFDSNKKTKQAGFFIDWNEDEATKLHYTTPFFTDISNDGFEASNLISDFVTYAVDMETSTYSLIVLDPLVDILLDADYSNKLNYWPISTPNLGLAEIIQINYITENSTITCVLGTPCITLITSFSISNCVTTEGMYVTTFRTVNSTEQFMGTDLVANVLKCLKSTQFNLKFVSICEQNFQQHNYSVAISQDYHLGEQLVLNESEINWNGSCTFTNIQTSVVSAPNFVTYLETTQKLYTWQLNIHAVNVFKQKYINTPPEFSYRLQDVYVTSGQMLKFKLPPIRDKEDNKFILDLIVGDAQSFTNLLDNYLILYPGLEINGIFSASITITDSNQNPLSTTYNFDIIVYKSIEQLLYEKKYGSSSDWKLYLNQTHIEDNSTSEYQNIQEEREMAKQLSLLQNKNIKDQKITAKITKITSTGQVNIKFSQQMKEWEYNFQLLNNSLELTILQANGEKESCKYEIQSMSDQKLIIQLNFEDFTTISQTSTLDKLKVKFKENYLFQNRLQTQTIMKDYEIEKDIPFQVSESMQEIFDKLGASSFNVISSFIGSSLIINLFLAQSLQYLWDMICSFQIITHLPLLTISTPANIQSFYGFIKDVSSDDEFEHQEYAHNSFFEGMGYETVSIIKNLGLIFYIFQVLIFFVVLERIANLIPIKSKSSHLSMPQILKAQQ